MTLLHNSLLNPAAESTVYCTERLPELLERNRRLIDQNRTALDYARNLLEIGLTDPSHLQETVLSDQLALLETNAVAMGEQRCLLQDILLLLERNCEVLRDLCSSRRQETTSNC